MWSWPKGGAEAEGGTLTAGPGALRRAGRVIVLDPQDRVLLFRYDDGPPNGRHWSTPGGGLNDGEDYPAGARRELAEETGWTDVPVGPEVYERTQIMEHADAIVRQHERFFLARVGCGRARAGRGGGHARLGRDRGVALVDAGGAGRHRLR